MSEIISLTVLQVNQYALSEPTVQAVPVDVIAVPVDILVNGVQANALVEVPPSGLNQLSQNLLVEETVSEIVTLANGGGPEAILYLSSLSSGNACAQTGPIYPITGITYNGGTTLCGSASSLDSNDMINLAGNTTYYASDGTNVRQAFKVAGAGVTTLVFTGPCIPC